MTTVYDNIEKYTNDVLRDTIQEHFAKEHKRMTNLVKATKDKLIEIIKKYEIPLPEMPQKQKKIVNNDEAFAYTYHKECKGITFKAFNTNQMFKIGDKFKDIYIYNVGGSHNEVVITNITPQQVHYQNGDEIKRISTKNFIRKINARDTRD